MKELPILFSGEMVRAILEGRKTQTRRVVKPQPVYDHGAWCVPGFTCNTEHGFKESVLLSSFRCPYGKPGDRLWVRETFAVDYEVGEGTRGQIPPVVFYRATDKETNWTSGKTPWKPSIHMPRKYSRITLEIVSVRVERLQDITEDDAKSEGCNEIVSKWWQWFGYVDGHRSVMEGGDPSKPPAPHWINPEIQEYRRSRKDQFQILWNSINAKRGFDWDLDPWVWVIEFRKLDEKT
jgi:hypothetical protein